MTYNCQNAKRKLLLYIKTKTTSTTTAIAATIKFTLNATFKQLTATAAATETSNIKELNQK